MHEKSTLVVIEIDTLSAEEQENARLREYAKQSGPAGVGMEPDEEVEESLMDMAKRYGQKALDYPVDLVKSEWDYLFGPRPSERRSPSIAMEQAGLDPQQGEGGTFTVAMPSGGVPEDVALSREAQSELLGMVRPIEAQTSLDVHGRDPDIVLMDWMGPETEGVESGLLTDLNPTDEQIDYAVRKSRGEVLIPVVPGSVGRMSEDMAEYNRLGGDAVSMELLEDAREVSDTDSDAMLSALMEDRAEYSEIQGASEGLVALREDLGRNVEAELISTEGTTSIYSVYSPRAGVVRYSYDSATGTGRIMGAQ